MNSKVPSRDVKSRPKLLALELSFQNGKLPRVCLIPERWISNTYLFKINLKVKEYAHKLKAKISVSII